MKAYERTLDYVHPPSNVHLVYIRLAQLYIQHEMVRKLKTGERSITFRAIAFIVRTMLFVNVKIFVKFCIHSKVLCTYHISSD